MSDAGRIGLGDVIRDARTNRRWSQAELADRAGVSRPTIARVEANNDATTATIAKIARSLDLTLELKDRG